MKHQVIPVTEFKAKCLALLDQLDQEGGEITVTKRGRPVATVQPAKRKPFKSCRGILKGKIHPKGDLENFETTHLWNVLNGEDWR